MVAIAAPTKSKSAAGRGHFQTLSCEPAGDAAGAATVTVHDALYGEHAITEPVLVDLLSSPAVQRLAGVCQHGITGLLDLTPRVTRLEHSVGAMLLVRAVGGSVEEQAAALLHDISHTVLSHVIDWAFPSKESFHEVHKDRYVATTDLVARLERHGMSASVLDEEDYPLVEQDSPHLCADRLDYGLRDSVAFGKLSVADAQRVFAALKAYPSATDTRRILALPATETELTTTLARAYLAADRDVYSHPSHVEMYRSSGGLIGDMVRTGAVREEMLWSMSDDEFWAALYEAADEDGRQIMDDLEAQRGKDLAPQRETLRKSCKVRTIDPDMITANGLQPLSALDAQWKNEREAYILSRKL